jgi:acyl-coenzyme A thioesterase PaaI-like protein
MPTYDLSWNGDELCGVAAVGPDVFVPGTTSVRTSVLAFWVDVTGGYLAVEAMDPLVPVTLHLEVHVHRPVSDYSVLRSIGRVIASGRTVTSCAVEFRTDDDEPVAIGTASFMAPDPDRRLPDHLRLGRQTIGGLPTAAFADGAGCERTAPGTAVLARSESGRNAVGSVSGALLALAVEEAALSLVPGTTLSTLSLRYVRPVRIGPAVATATMSGSIGHVEVRDAGQDDRLAVTAVTRAF